MRLTAATATAVKGNPYLPTTYNIKAKYKNGHRWRRANACARSMPIKVGVKISIKNLQKPYFSILKGSTCNTILCVLIIVGVGN